MDIRLGHNRYGKAEVRLVHVDRSAPEHRLTDLTVSVALSGDLAATHLTGDNTGVLPTDTQKNTVYAFARDGVGEPEDFALRLARHFVGSQPTIHRARVSVRCHAWDRIATTGHSFARAAGTRTTTVTHDDGATPGTWVVSGVSDLTVLNTTGSQFHGYLRDAWTTLPETTERILATAVTAQWRHASPTAPQDTDDGGDSGGGPGWGAAHAATVGHLLAAFAETPSLSLQQTLYAMGERVLRHRPELAEVRLTLPNKHHFLVDLAPFGLDNPHEVYHAADRPYGLIEGTVLRADAAPGEEAW
jgi:urate oxidase